jgi:hypothetical protein
MVIISAHAFPLQCLEKAAEVICHFVQGDKTRQLHQKRDLLWPLQVIANWHIKLPEEKLNAITVPTDLLEIVSLHCIIYPSVELITFNVTNR